MHLRTTTVVRGRKAQILRVRTHVCSRAPLQHQPVSPRHAIPHSRGDAQPRDAGAGAALVQSGSGWAAPQTSPRAGGVSRAAVRGPFSEGRGNGQASLRHAPGGRDVTRTDAAVGRTLSGVCRPLKGRVRVVLWLLAVLWFVLQFFVFVLFFLNNFLVFFFLGVF